MRIEKHRIIWTGIKGRNGGISPVAIADDEAVEAVNVEVTQEGALFSKRFGSIALLMSGGPAGSVNSLLSFVPAVSDFLTVEFWVFADSNIFRYADSGAGAYGWTTPTEADAIVTTTGVTGAALNSKFFLAYDSAVNRLHTWDGSTVRRVGLIQAGTAPTVANTGSGSYAATARYYRTAWAHISGSTHVRRSELSAAVSFTPSGSGTHARVTQPAVASEGETHWLVYASADDVYSNYHLVATVAIGTTTYDDNTAPASYVGDAPQVAGMNIPPPSAKYIITDGNRLVMAGAHESSATTGQTAVKNNRVWFTRVLESSAIGDDESIPNTAASGVTPAQKNWIDIGENDGDGIYGLVLFNNSPYVFKRQSIHRLVATSDDLAPYRAIEVSHIIGTSNHKSLVEGEDRQGQPVLYFANELGVYRLTTDGDIHWISEGIDDLWKSTVLSTTATAFTGVSGVFSLYHGQRGQLHVCNLSDGSSQLNVVYDVIAEGWTLVRHATTTTFACGTMGRELKYNPVDIKQTSTVEKPYVGGLNNSLGQSVIWKFDAEESSTDGQTVTAGPTVVPGSTFQGYAKSKPYFPAGLGTNIQTHDAVLLAKAASGVTLTATIDRDFAAETKTATVVLTAAGSETRVIRRVEESGFGSLGSVQFQIGDASAIANRWVLDALTIPLGTQEAKS